MGSSDDEKQSGQQHLIDVQEPAAAHVATERKERGPDDDEVSIHTLHSLAASEHSTLADQDGQDIEASLERTLTPRRPVVKVPRSSRRGLFARFCVVAEVTEPWDYKNSVKWCIVCMVALAAAAAPVGSAIILRMCFQWSLVCI